MKSCALLEGRLGYAEEQNYLRCLCLDSWTKQGGVSGPISCVLALQHHALTGSIWTFPTRYSLKVARHGAIRQEQICGLKSMLYLQAMPCHNCLVIVFIKRGRKNRTGIWNKITLSVGGTHFRPGSKWACWREFVAQSRALKESLWVLRNSKLEFLYGWWQWRQEKVSGFRSKCSGRSNFEVSSASLRLLPLSKIGNF